MTRIKTEVLEDNNELISGNFHVQVFDPGNQLSFKNISIAFYNDLLFIQLRMKLFLTRV